MQRRCIRRIQSLYRLYLIVYKKEERYENDLFLQEAKKKKKKKKAVTLNQNRNYIKGCHSLHKKRREKRKEEKKRKIFEERGSMYIKGIARWALALHRSYLCCCPSVSIPL